jgi:hypothetical protein
MSRMSLSEYIAQDIPERMPEVILTEEDYKVLTTIKVAGWPTLTLVSVNLWPLSVPREYVKKEGEVRLYTTDEDGNPKTLSCFSIHTLI